MQIPAGTWHLQSCEHQLTTGEKLYPLTQAAEGYVAYSGRYEIRERENKVLHHVELSLFPNWIGTTQERFYKLSPDGKQLTLYTPPFTANGKEQVAYLIWRK